MPRWQLEATVTMEFFIFVKNVLSLQKTRLTQIKKNIKTHFAGLTSFPFRIGDFYLSVMKR